MLILLHIFWEVTENTILPFQVKPTGVQELFRLLKKMGNSVNFYPLNEQIP